MSTKIYNGRLLRGPIGSVYPLLLEAKPNAIAIAKRLETAWMGRRAAELIDDAAVKGKTVENPLLEAWSEIQDRQRKVRIESRRDPAVDFEFELCLFPRRRTTLAIIHTEQRELQDWFDGLPFVTHYGYWDNTDQPDDLTSRQWNDRRKAWEEALPGAGVPSDRCLTFTMVTGSNSWFTDAADAIVHVPSPEKRLKRLVEERLRSEHYHAKIEAKRVENPDFKPDGFGMYFEASDAARADEAGRERIAAQIAPLLRPLTADDLAGGMKKKED